MLKKKIGGEANVLFIIVICGFDTEVFGMQVNLADIKKKCAVTKKNGFNKHPMSLDSLKVALELFVYNLGYWP